MATQTQSPRPRRFRLSRTTQREAMLGIMLLLPTLIVIAAIILRPLADSLWLSLFRQDLLSLNPEPEYVGLANYVWLFESRWFPTVFVNTVVLTIVVVNLQLWFALGISMLLDFDFPGRNIVRTLLIAPWAVPVIVTAFMWRWMLDPTFGPVNYYLIRFGLLEAPLAWLGNRFTAMPSVILVLLWKGLPFMLLAMIAGLQQVPRETREAARVDGANWWQEFWHVVLPAMRHIIILMVILRTIFLFNHFDLIYLLTGGGPGDATLVLSIQAINLGFSSFRFGRAAAITTFMFLILVVLSILYFRTLRMSKREV